MNLFLGISEDWDIWNRFVDWVGEEKGGTNLIYIIYKFKL